MVNKKKTNWRRFILILLGFTLFGIFCYLVGVVYGQNYCRELFDTHLMVMQIADSITLGVAQ